MVDSSVISRLNELVQKLLGTFLVNMHRVAPTQVFVFCRTQTYEEGDAVVGLWASEGFELLHQNAVILASKDFPEIGPRSDHLAYPFYDLMDTDNSLQIEKIEVQTGGKLSISLADDWALNILVKFDPEADPESSIWTVYPEKSGFFGLLQSGSQEEFN